MVMHEAGSFRLHVPQIPMICRVEFQAFCRQVQASTTILLESRGAQVFAAWVLVFRTDKSISAVCFWAKERIEKILEFLMFNVVKARGFQRERSGRSSESYESSLFSLSFTDEKTTYKGGNAKILFQKR